MNLEMAKQLKYNDKILIKYPDVVFVGRFESLSKNGYIHYFAPHTMSTQRIHRSNVELHLDTKGRFLREGITKPQNDREKRFVEEFGISPKV